MEELQLLLDKTRCLLFRALMIGNTPNEIVDGFENTDDYVSFMNIINYMLENDKDFFFLKDFISKTQLIISLGSNKFNDSKEILDIRNKYIIELNKLKLSTDIIDIIDDYLDGETVMREYFPYNDELLFKSMHNDYYVLTKLQEALDGNNKLNEIENHQFLESTAYFTYMMPEIYQLFPESIELTKNEISRIIEEEPNHRRSIKLIKKDLSKFK